MGDDILLGDKPEPPGTITQKSHDTSITSLNVLPANSKAKHYTKNRVQRNFALSEKTASLDQSSLHITLFRKRWYPDVTQEQWNDWRWQFQNRIRTYEQVDQMFLLSADERAAFVSGNGRLPVAITPYYASLLDVHDSEQPLRKIVVPNVAETIVSRGESIDPLHENAQSPVEGLVHRYPDRVLFLVSNLCASNCRYCTRSRIIEHNCQKTTMAKANWEKCIRYIESHSEVRDVLLSGGDPLILSDNSLQWLLERLRKIEHVEIIRIGTRAPVVLPQRITPALTQMLRKYHPLLMSIHFTHPDEITAEVAEACGRLADAGIPLGSQTVLLRGINDNLETMRQLVHKLLKIRVRPYYLYQCDPIAGSAHLRASVARGLDIIKGLRGFTSGYAIPHYVIDAPGGGGKIPVSPNYTIGYEGDTLLLRNFEDKVFGYVDNGL
ncbi:MAG: KamA family radical SAM protein [Chitinivibrionales bacterium]|nr:KamA family radical SAM protein [Chitinivibrionales bacterium]